jgi:hypothetical protein
MDVSEMTDLGQYTLAIELCKSGLHRSTSKGTLHGDNYTFSAAPRHPLDRSSGTYVSADPTHVCYQLCKAGSDWSQINRCLVSVTFAVTTNTHFANNIIT